ncbi:MAG: exonuclease SbcCD subunit D [Eubacteriales bacterium]|nr:exonuclease SbcCD subunit D [Eubacteriales bacterium]
MKFLHLGDLHIGKSLGEFHLIEDQRFILEQILEIAKCHSVDAVLIAGDIYDKSIPSEEAVRLFDYFIRRLAGMRLKTFVISGNHDSDERLNFGSSLFEANEVYISAKYEGGLYRQELQDEYGKINVYLLPFVKASQVRHFFPEAEITSYDQAVRVVLDQAKIDVKERNILVAHQFVAGKNEDPVMAGSESVSVLNVGLVEKIGTDCFEDFDYVALGHLHSPQRVGREEIRYAGSPLKYSLSEVNNEKSVPIIAVGEKGLVSVELVGLRPRRDLRHLKGKLKQLLDKKHMDSTDDFVYVTLTDEEPVDNAMGIIRQYYPNTIKIDYDNAHTRAIEQADISQISENQSFSDLILDFYRSMYGCDMSEEEMAVMKEAAGEAGVAYETD